MSIDRYQLTQPLARPHATWTREGRRDREHDRLVALIERRTDAELTRVSAEGQIKCAEETAKGAQAMTAMLMAINLWKAGSALGENDPGVLHLAALFAEGHAEDRMLAMRLDSIRGR